MIFDVFRKDSRHFEVRQHQKPVAQIVADSEEDAVVQIGEHCTVTDDGIALDIEDVADDVDTEELDEIVSYYQHCNEEGKRQIAITAMMAAKTFSAGDNVIMFRKY